MSHSVLHFRYRLRMKRTEKVKCDEVEVEGGTTQQRQNDKMPSQKTGNQKNRTARSRQFQRYLVYQTTQKATYTYTQSLKVKSAAI